MVPTYVVHAVEVDAALEHGHFLLGEGGQPVPHALLHGHRVVTMEQRVREPTDLELQVPVIIMVVMVVVVVVGP